MRFRPMQSGDLDTVVGIENMVAPVPWPTNQFIESIKNHDIKDLVITYFNTWLEQKN